MQLARVIAKMWLEFSKHSFSDEEVTIETLRRFAEFVIAEAEREERELEAELSTVFRVVEETNQDGLEETAKRFDQAGKTTLDPEKNKWS